MFFYLKWIDKRPTQIELMEERPDDINYETTFRIHKDKYILCGNINPLFVQYYPPPKLENEVQDTKNIIPEDSMDVWFRG